MGRWFLTTLAAVCAGVYGLSFGDSETGIDREVYAANESGAVSVQCITPDQVAFVPVILYVVQPRRPEVLTPSISAQLIGAVNGQGGVTSLSQWSDSRLTMTHATPTMKLAGMQCRTVTSSELQVSLDYSQQGQRVAILNTRPSRGHPPFLAAGQMDVLFGTNGRINKMPLSDGQDADALMNGEIAFGGPHSSSGGTTTVLEQTDTVLAHSTLSRLRFTFIAH